MFSPRLRLPGTERLCPPRAAPGSPATGRAPERPPKLRARSAGGHAFLSPPAAALPHPENRVGRRSRQGTLCGRRRAISGGRSQSPAKHVHMGQRDIPLSPVTSPARAPPWVEGNIQTSGFRPGECVCGRVGVWAGEDRGPPAGRTQGRLGSHTSRARRAGDVSTPHRSQDHGCPELSHRESCHTGSCHTGSELLKPTPKA